MIRDIGGVSPSRTWESYLGKAAKTDRIVAVMTRLYQYLDAKSGRQELWMMTSHLSLCWMESNSTSGRRLATFSWHHGRFIVDVTPVGNCTPENIVFRYKATGHHSALLPLVIYRLLEQPDLLKILMTDSSAMTVEFFSVVDRVDDVTVKQAKHAMSELVKTLNMRKEPSFYLESAHPDDPVTSASDLELRIRTMGDGTTSPGDLLASIRCDLDRFIVCIPTDCNSGNLTGETVYSVRQIHGVQELLATRGIRETEAL